MPNVSQHAQTMSLIMVALQGIQLVIDQPHTTKEDVRGLVTDLITTLAKIKA